jgi:threonine/homoserine/homoserine lactone efflux protein
LKFPTLLLLGFTVLPLICTHGPDILFTASQGLSSGRRGALRAVVGVLFGYIAHAVLSDVGDAALIAASHWLFEFLHWLGVGYLAYLALVGLARAFPKFAESDAGLEPRADWSGNI